MFNPRRNKKGFTIIELIVVIAIIAILAAIAIPSFIGITAEANSAVAIANARSIATAINSYNALNPNGTLIAEEADLDAAALPGTLAGLWPQGMDDVQGALDLIDFSSGVAVVTPPVEE